MMEEQPEGIQLDTEFITSEEENFLLYCINNQKWSTLSRGRTQQYGWSYNYIEGPIKKIKPLPEWAINIVQKMMDKKYITQYPDQLIIDEYILGREIGTHTDSEQFGDTIISLSLLSIYLFQFKKHFSSEKTYDLCLEPGTLCTMKGESRYKWKHQISVKKINIASRNHHSSERTLRSKGILLTFRYVSFDVKYEECRKKLIKWIKNEYSEKGWKFFDPVLDNAEKIINDILNSRFKKKYKDSKRYEAVIIWNHIRRKLNVRKLMYELYLTKLNKIEVVTFVI